MDKISNLKFFDLNFSDFDFSDFWFQIWNFFFDFSSSMIIQYYSGSFDTGITTYRSSIRDKISDLNFFDLKLSDFDLSDFDYFPTSNIEISFWYLPQLTCSMAHVEWDALTILT